MAEGISPETFLRQRYGMGFLTDPQGKTNPVSHDQTSQQLLVILESPGWKGATVLDEDEYLTRDQARRMCDTDLGTSTRAFIQGPCYLWWRCWDCYDEPQTLQTVEYQISMAPSIWESPWNLWTTVLSNGGVYSIDQDFRVVSCHNVWCHSGRHWGRSAAGHNHDVLFRNTVDLWYRRTSSIRTRLSRM